MKVLILHDRYEETLPNGENAVVRWEAEGIQELGASVRLVETHAATLREPLWRRGLVHLGGVYSIPWQRKVTAELREFQPDVIHIHNLWPHITPSVYSVARKAGVPVVQTLHNYRLLCVADFLCRDGVHCELCLGRKFAWSGIRNRCVESSMIKSVIKTTAFGVHHALNTWDRAVDAFIVPSEHMKHKFIQGGMIDPKKLHVKPTCSPDSEVSAVDRTYFCFAGRLRYEKGVRLLLEAWRNIHDAELRIVGAGPLEGEVRAAAAANPSIRYLGMVSSAEVADLMRGAIATIVPSTWEEPCPVTIVQSFSTGTPVIASDLGPRKEMVTPGETGLVFAAGITQELVNQVRWAASHRDLCARMGQAALEDFTSKYSISSTCKILMKIYRYVLEPSDTNPG